MTLTATPKDDFTLNDGFISFGLTEAVTPTVEAPVKLVVVAKAAGFLPTSMPVYIDQTGSHTFSINMVEMNNLPDMLTAAGLCIINWIVSTYLEDDDLSDDEYLVYLKHSVRLMYSIEKQRRNISQMAADLLT